MKNILIACPLIVAVATSAFAVPPCVPGQSQLDCLIAVDPPKDPLPPAPQGIPVQSVELQKALLDIHALLAQMYVQQIETNRLLTTTANVNK